MKRALAAGIIVSLGIGIGFCAEEFGFGDYETVEANRDIQVGGAEGGNNRFREEELLDVVKGAVNWILGILALIALILLLYGGLLMATAAGDDGKFQKGQKILKSAAIGLTIIGVAWFIISMIFRLTIVTGEAAEGTTAGTEQ